MQSHIENQAPCSTTHSSSSCCQQPLPETAAAGCHWLLGTEIQGSQERWHSTMVAVGTEEHPWHCFRVRSSRLGGSVYESSLETQCKKKPLVWLPSPLPDVQDCFVMGYAVPIAATTKPMPSRDLTDFFGVFLCACFVVGIS